MDKINYREYEKVIKEIEELSKIKNKDYGCNSLTRFGNYGILVRISDKLDRLKTLYENGNRRHVKDETIQDTIKDVVNYAIYMLLQERGTLVEKINGKRKPKSR